AQVVRPRGRDDVEAPGTRNAVDARLAAGLSVEARRLRRRRRLAAALEAALLGEPPVQRHALPEQPDRVSRPSRRAGAARRSGARDTASPAARACRRAGRSTDACRATPRARAASAPS